MDTVYLIIDLNAGKGFSGLESDAYADVQDAWREADRLRKIHPSMRLHVQTVNVRPFSATQK